MAERSFKELADLFAAMHDDTVARREDSPLPSPEATGQAKLPGLAEATSAIDAALQQLQAMRSHAGTPAHDVSAASRRESAQPEAAAPPSRREPVFETPQARLPVATSKLISDEFTRAMLPLEAFREPKQPRRRRQPASVASSPQRTAIATKEFISDEFTRAMLPLEFDKSANRQPLFTSTGTTAAVSGEQIERISQDTATEQSATQRDNAVNLPGTTNRVSFSTAQLLLGPDRAAMLRPQEATPPASREAAMKSGTPTQSQRPTVAFPELQQPQRPPLPQTTPEATPPGSREAVTQESPPPQEQRRTDAAALGLRLPESRTRQPLQTTQATGVASFAFPSLHPEERRQPLSAPQAFGIDAGRTPISGAGDGVPGAGLGVPRRESIFGGADAGRRQNLFGDAGGSAGAGGGISELTRAMKDLTREMSSLTEEMKKQSRSNSAGVGTGAGASKYSPLK